MLLILQNTFYLIIYSILGSLFFNLLKKPGLWLQNITTKHPEDNMVEVSITALKEAFGDRYEDMAGKEYKAEAIG